MRGQHSGTEAAQGHTAGDGAPKASPTDHVGYANLLGQVDLFLGLERVTLAKLAAHLEPLFYSSGSVIFRQAEPGDAFYLVATGSVGVYSTGRSSAAETRVKTLQAGEPFGEMALLTNSPRTATIKAETDCEVLRLDRNSFLDLVREQPSVALSIAATLSRRLAAMLDQPEAVDAAVAPVAAHADGET
jgi:CRP-like cAMP-binding protein